MFCATLGQWAAAWIPCRSPFQPTAGFPSRPFAGIRQGNLDRRSRSTFGLCWCSERRLIFYLLISRAVKCEDRLLWFCVTNSLSDQNCKGWRSQVFAHSAIYKQALVRWNWIKSSIFFVSFNPKDLLFCNIWHVLKGQQPVNGVGKKKKSKTCIHYSVFLLMPPDCFFLASASTRCLSQVFLAAALLWLIPKLPLSWLGV